MSLDQFYEYPILGNPAFAYLGGHSYLMDVLGGFGLVGFILWSSTFCILSYQMIKVIPKGCKLYYLFALVVFVAMIISKVLAQTLFFAIWFMLPLLLAAREQTYWEAVFRVRRMLGFRNRLRQNVR